MNCSETFSAPAWCCCSLPLLLRPHSRQTNPVKDAPAAACHDTSPLHHIHNQTLINKQIYKRNKLNLTLLTVDIVWCRRLLPLAGFKEAVRCGSCGLSASSHRPPLGSGCSDTSTVIKARSGPADCLSVCGLLQPDRLLHTYTHTRDSGWAGRVTPPVGPPLVPPVHAVLSCAHRRHTRLHSKIRQVNAAGSNVEHREAGSGTLSLSHYNVKFGSSKTQIQTHLFFSYKV